MQSDELIDLQMRRSWNEGETRAFLATTLDVGWVYLRPRVSFGYGMPFKGWFGVDVNPIVAGHGLGAYGGLRLALPRFDLRIGPRYFASFSRNYLNPQNSYNRVDLDSTLGAPARVITLETELEFSVPAGPGDIVALGSLSYVTNVPDRPARLRGDPSRRRGPSPRLARARRLRRALRNLATAQHRHRCRRARHPEA